MKKEDLVWRVWNCYFRKVFPYLDRHTREDLYQEIELIRLEIEELQDKKARVRFISRRFYLFLKQRGWKRIGGGRWKKIEILSNRWG